MPPQDSPENIRYIVGTERRLEDVLRAEDVAPLLREALRTGVHRVIVGDDAGKTLWTSGDGVPATMGEATENCPLRLEGEPVGTVKVFGNSEKRDLLKAVASLLSGTLNILAATNLKRMLTTELHTTVVSQSYEDLLIAHRELKASETRYRELAETLEKKVDERTAELKRAYNRLLQSEKMAAVGQLAAGVAHEINNPVGFVTSNLQTLRKYVSRFTEMLAVSREILNGQPPASETFNRKWRELKLDFVTGDVEELLRQSLEGTERVKRIVADLKGFSHIDESELSPLNINRELERTLKIMARAFPGESEIIKDFHPLPNLIGNGSLLCQAFMNIILNAVQAQPQTLQLTIETRYQDGQVRITFSDNGPGIPTEIRNRIFEPFFTTRDVGQGTGMGLAVTYDIVTSMGGTIDVTCPEAGGAVFSIALPLQEH